MERYQILNLSYGIIFVILCCCIFYLIGWRRSEIKVHKMMNEQIIKVNPTELTLKEIIDDLEYIINNKCSHVYQKILLPLKSKTLGNSDSLINDETLNNITIEICNEINKQLSDSYKEKVYEVINKNEFESFLLGSIYDKLSVIVLNMNRESIKKIF